MNAATSIKELIEVWTKNFHRFGFDFVIYNLFSGFGAHEKKPYQRTHTSNVPVEVQEHYREISADPFDPILKYTFSTMDPLWMSDAAILPYFQEPAPALFLQKAHKYVEDGLSVPMIGQNFMKGYVFAAYKKTDTPRDTLFEKGSLTNWQVKGLCHLLHSRYCKLLISKQIKIELTNREMDVLHLVVAGKTNREIGKALGISVNTVNSYLKNLFMKMNTTDRVTTALKAYSMNLIAAPQDIHPSQHIPVRSTKPADEATLQPL